jgi:hypothetical protein
MLGAQMGEVTGQITGMRVLPDEGHGARVEVSFQQSGTCWASTSRSRTMSGSRQLRH